MSNLLGIIAWPTSVDHDEVGGSHLRIIVVDMPQLNTPPPLQGVPPLNLQLIPIRNADS